MEAQSGPMLSSFIGRGRDLLGFHTGNLIEWARPNSRN